MIHSIAKVAICLGNAVSGGYDASLEAFPTGSEDPKIRTSCVS